MRRVLLSEHDNHGAIDIRVAPIDVGFDLRPDTPVEVRPDATSASYERDGDVWVIEGTAEEITTELRAAGYTVKEGERS